ncbi:MAG: hypothetical protein HY695_00595 [Deltaproteobacteria bacterium]|nr:hypothetical protein [Deltaproteobacteria bacterium]
MKAQVRCFNSPARRTSFWIAIALALLAGASRIATAEISNIRKQLDDHLNRCTETHGYNPETASNLGPHALGAGEREWRECVYQGIEKHVIPKALAPEAYRRVIAEDRDMTERVASGRMTRAERRTRMLALLEEIERREEAEAKRLIKEAVKREQEMMLMRDRRSMIRPLGR